MCNGDEFIHEAFDENPLLESTEKAIELYEELADDGEEEEERRKVMRHGKKSLKHKKSHKRLHRRDHQDEGEEGDDAGVSRDTLMEFRILGAGTFSVAD